MSTASFDEERPFVSEYKQVPGSKQLRRSLKEKITTTLLVLNTLVVLIAVVACAMLPWRLTQPERAGCFDGEFSPTWTWSHSNSLSTDTLLNPPIIWESRTFNSTIDERQRTVVDHTTPTSPILTADWGALLDVGEIRLSEEEAARLAQGTAHVYGV